jgi:translocation and assembly module TamA
VTPGQIEQLYKTAPEQIGELLATEGYFSPQITPSIDRTRTPAVIRFAIDPGTPSRIETIDLRITGPVTHDPQGAQRIAQAKAAFPLKVGDTFRQKLWDQGKQAMVQSLAAHVYAAAEVASSRVRIDPQAHSARVELEVTSGPAVTFGPLTAHGLQRYQRSIVANLNPIRAGDPYDEAQLIKFQRRLLATGYFASAIVTARPQEGSKVAAVQVNVVEAPSH